MCGFSVQSVEAHGTCAELGGGKKGKKWISLRLNIVFLKQNNIRDKVVRAPSRGSTHVSFFCGSEGLFFFRLIIIIRCREDLEAGARRVKAYLGKYVIDVIDYTSRALLNQYKIKTLSCACPLQPARIGLHVQRIFKPRPSTECAFTWVGCGRGARVWPRVSRSENKRLHELTTCLCGCGYLRYACARDTQFLPWKCEYLVPLTPSNKDGNMMTARGRVLHSRCAYRVCFFFFPSM